MYLALIITAVDFRRTFLSLVKWLKTNPIQHVSLLDTIHLRSLKMSGTIWRHGIEDTKKKRENGIERIMCADAE